jgi:hypothetical protein
VLTQPGHTELMVTLERAISMAMARVIPIIACLEAQ